MITTFNRILFKFQSRYSGGRVAYDARPGIKFQAQGRSFTAIDTFPGGVRFTEDSAAGSSFYESYERLVQVNAVYS